MTRELFHKLWDGFEYDPDLFMDTALFDKVRNYRYDAENTDAHFNKRVSQSNTITFAIMLDGNVIGELVLKHFDSESKHCELGIQMKNDHFKNKGFGTEAERLALIFAFDKLGMETVLADCIAKNERSQHVLKKLGFKQIDEREGFRYFSINRGDFYAIENNRI